MNKKETFKQFIKSWDKFICPICKEHLVLTDYSLKCCNNHNYDISKKGTVALCKTSKIKEDKLYNSVLFENRTEFILNGFYNELYNVICNVIDNAKNLIILDVGCGDGTHDKIILDKINSSNKIIGIDLAKDGINVATRCFSNNFLPILSDLHNLPFTDESIDVVLNILSPINEEEIKRVLKQDGIIIKVAPTKDYLKELRNLLDINEYKNEEILEDNLSSKYEFLDKIIVNNTYDINKINFSNLINMTPMTKYKKINGIIDKITISLNVFVLKIKK